MHNRPRKLLAEFAGTFAVVFCTVGAICLNRYLVTGDHRALGALGVALAYGVAAGAASAIAARFCRDARDVNVSATPASRSFAPSDDRTQNVYLGYFNPAFTFALWAIRRLGTFDLFAFCAAELAGASAAAYVLRVTVPVGIWSVVALGTPNLRDGLTRGPGMLIEGMATFFLVLILFALSAAGRTAIRGFAGAVIGLAVTTGVFFALPFTGGSINPARAFGPALASRHWTNHGVYWIGPLAGALLGAWIHEAGRMRSRAAGPEPAPHDGRALSL